MPEFHTHTPLLTERFDDALRYATRHHGDALWARFNQAGGRGYRVASTCGPAAS